MSLLIDRVIAYYECEDATDSHTGGIDLTESNGPTYVTGKVGNGVDCDSTAQSGLVLANASAGALQMGTGGYAVSFWFNAASLPSSGNAGALVWMGAINSADVGWHVIYNNSGGTGQVVARLASGATLFSATASGYGTGTWRHVVAIWDRPGNLSVHIDGVRAASVSIAAASAVDIQSVKDFRIGGQHSVYFDGVIDEVVIFDYAVPLSVVDWLYNDGSGRSYSELSALTTLGGRFRENFGSLATGTGTPAGFTALGATNATFEVVTDAGSEGGQALEIQKSGAGDTRLALDEIGGYTQLDMVIEAEVSGSGLDIGMIMGSSGASGSQNEYLLRLSGTALTISEISAGVLTIRATAASAIGSAVTSGVVYAMRFRRQLDTLYGRVWIPASEDEPSGWDVTWADSSPFGGRSAGVAFVSSSGTLTVHYIAAAVGGDAACILDNDDLPTTGVIVAYQTDSSIRMLSDDGSTHALISIIGAGSTPNIQGLAVHQGNKTIFACKRAGGAVVRVDQYGMNETTINDTIPTPFGITIDEATGTLYITDRSDRECYTDDIDGGSEASLFTTTGNLGYPYFDGTYLWYTDDAVIYRRDADGANQTSYGSLANPLAAISDGTTMVGGWFQTNTGIRSKPVASPGDSFTSVDTVTVQALAINGDGTETYGSNVGTDAVYHWSDYPPTTANRTQISSIDAPKGLGWFDFAAGGETGTITEGASAGDTFVAIRSRIASITEGAAAGDTDTGLRAITAAIVEGAAAGEAWAKTLARLGTITEGAVAGDEMLSGGVAGAITEGSEAGDAFIAAVAHVAQMLEGGTAGDTFAAAVARYAAIIEGARAGDTFVAVRSRLGTITEGAEAGDTITTVEVGTSYLVATVRIFNALAANPSLYARLSGTPDINPD